MTNPADIFDKIASLTWDVLAHAHRERISYGEDAITSVNLIALKNERLSGLAIEDTRVNESSKGCDFEFWIGDNTNGWYRYAIQAKKVTIKTGIYSSLAHKVNGKPQIDILDEYAKANKAVPLYCLYNNSIQAPRVFCPLWPSDFSVFGCSITSSARIRKALKKRGDRSFTAIHSDPEALPWSCLVRCPMILSHWPPFADKDSLRYATLPADARNLLAEQINSVGAADETPPILESELFSKETNYRPQWIGVVDLSNG